MPRFSDISKTLRKLVGHQPDNPVSLVAERFLQVFREHGIEATQIPRLLPEIKLEYLQSPETLLPELNHDLLDKVAKLFGIRVQWLEGCDERIYDYLATYKEPQLLLDHLRSLWHQPAWANEVGTPLRILSTTKHLDYREDYSYELAPILVEPVAKLGEETIYRYHVYQDGFSWDHSSARIELKAIALTAYKALHKPIPIYPISERDMEAVLEGRRIPFSLLGRCLNTDPSLEDYILDKSESVVAKETDELPDVLGYMAKVGLDAYDFQSIQQEVVATMALEPVPKKTQSQPLTSPKPGKQAARDEIWKKIEAAAITLWAQDKTLAIAEVVRRLMVIPELKAFALQPNTIHKRIAKFAPLGIKGKSGRKPQKSG